MTAVECIWNEQAELGEGVFWHEREQAIYWVDIIQSKVHRLAKNRSPESWNIPGQTSAIVPCEEGGLLAAFENGLSHIDLVSETVTPLVLLEDGIPHNRFNDGCSDTRGNFVFGSMDDRQLDATGSFYRLNRSGTVTILESFGKMCITNGPAFSTDGNWIFFTDTVAGKIFRAPLDGEGSPGRPELHIDFSNYAGHPDGMCTDTEGGLWICHFAGSRISRFREDGTLEREILLPVPNVTKCTFGGKALRTLYITTAATGLDESQRRQFPLSGGLFTVETTFQGVPTVAVPRPSCVAH